MKNIRWKVFTVIGVFVVFFVLGVYPILANRYGAPAPQWLKDKALKLGLDLRGGVHLVLRVHTDEALRTSTTTTGEQLRAAASTAGVNVTSVNVTSPTSFRVEGVPQDRDAEFRRVADEITGASYDRNPGAGGAYDFTMRPNIANQMREQTVVQAQETIERRVNELGVSEPNISVYGNTGDQLLVQLPGDLRCRPRQGDHPLDRPAEAQDRRSRPGVERRCAAHAARRQAAGRHGSDHGRRRRRHAVLPGEEAGADHRSGSAHRAFDARRERPARRRLLADARRRREVRQAHRREHRPAARGHPRQPRRDRRHDSDADQRRGAHLRQLHAGRSRGPRADAEFRRAAGQHELSRGTPHRPDARRRLDPVGRRSRRSPASCSSCSSCCRTTSSPASTPSWRWSAT